MKKYSRTMLLMLLNLFFIMRIECQEGGDLIAALSRGFSAGTTELNIFGGKGSALEETGAATSLLRPGVESRGLFAGKSGSNISGTGAGRSGTGGGTELTTRGGATTTKSTFTGGSILEMLSGTGTTGSLTRGGTSILTPGANAREMSEAGSSTTISGRGRGATRTESNGGLRVTPRLATGTNNIFGEAGLEMASGQGTTGISTRGGVDITRGNFRGTSGTTGEGLVNISGPGTGRVTTTGSNTVNIGEQ